MTKQEFDEKFKATYNNALKSLNVNELMREELTKIVDADGQIPSEALAGCVLKLSILLNQQILKSVLPALFEFDE